MKVLRTLSKLFIMTVVMTTVQGWSTESDEIAVLEIPEDCHILGAALTERGASDSYLEAYLQGVLDTKYPDSGAIVSVRNGDIILSRLPANKHRSDQMIHLFATLQKDLWRSRPLHLKRRKKRSWPLKDGKVSGFLSRRSYIPHRLPTRDRSCFL